MFNKILKSDCGQVLIGNKDKKFKIQTRLNQKYDCNFNFFKVKEINEIIYDNSKKISNIIFKDQNTLNDTNEYLKRLYFFCNSSSRNQIHQRIKRLTKFYQENLIMTYEYPMMVITNTKPIFNKRLKRMKSMIAMEDSSDFQSSVQQGIQLSISSTIFLKTSYSSYQSQNETYKKSKQSKQASFQSYHDIYSKEEEQKQTLKLFKESDQYYLNIICDFDDVDLEQAKFVYDKARAKKQMMAKIQKQEEKKKKKVITSSIVITPIDNVEFMINQDPNQYGFQNSINQQSIIRINNGVKKISDKKKIYQRRSSNFGEIQNKRQKGIIEKYYENEISKQQNVSRSQNDRIKAIKQKAAYLLYDTNYKNIRYY